MLTSTIKLVPDVRGDARFDAASAQSNEEKAEAQPEPRMIEREHAVTDAIEQREREDRPKFANKGVGQDRSENTEEISCRDKGVVPLSGLLGRHEILGAAVRQEVMRHER